jgi:hypothetical protein
MALMVSLLLVILTSRAPRTAWVRAITTVNAKYLFLALIVAWALSMGLLASLDLEVNTVGVPALIGLFAGIFIFMGFIWSVIGEQGRPTPRHRAEEGDRGQIGAGRRRTRAADGPSGIAPRPQGPSSPRTIPGQASLHRSAWVSPLRAALELLAALLGRDPDDEHLAEYVAILALIVVVAVLSLIFLGDAIADLISLIGGRVDEATLSD